MAVAAYFNFVDRTLMKVYALHIHKLMPSVIKKKCFGCEMGRDSQLDHDICQMMDVDERVKYCLQDAVKLVDERQVTMSLRRMLSMKKFLCHPGYIFTTAWRSQLWDDEEWCHGVVAELMKLR